MISGKGGMIAGKDGAARACWPSIAAEYARALVGLATKKGADRRTLLRIAGIDAAELMDPERRIDFAKFVLLMRGAKAMTGDVALALHFGESFTTDQLSIVGLIGLSCRSTADAARELDRYSRLIADVDLENAADGKRYALTRIAKGTLLIDRRKDPNAFPELTESSFARMTGALRRLDGGNGFIKAAYFSHAMPSYRAEYERIFRGPLHFGCGRNALLFCDTAWDRQPSPNPSPYLLRILKQRADRLLNALPIDDSTGAAVKALVAGEPQKPLATAETIASRLGISRQALHSRLKNEGTSYTHIVGEFRRREALRLLRGGVSVAETASCLGYSDPAAFSRAFKRWTGTKPSAVRKVHHPENWSD